MTASPELVETERLVLRRWVEEDWRALMRLTGDAEVMRYIGSGATWDEERTRQFITRQMQQCDSLGFCLWALAEKEGGELIGQTGIQPLGQTGEIEIGWWLARDRWGHGLATEAARAALCFGFEKARLERIVSIAHPDNRASWHIMEKLGLQRERTTTAAVLGLAHGEIPVVLYAIHRSKP